jgi:hypothetical protein
MGESTEEKKTGGGRCDLWRRFLPFLRRHPRVGHVVCFPLQSTKFKRMLYCEECRTERCWPEGLRLSTGRCELCSKTLVCHDRPSRSLPSPKRPESAMSMEVRRIAQERLGLYALDYTNDEHPEIRDVTVEDIRAALEAAYRAGEASAKYIPPRS